MTTTLERELGPLTPGEKQAVIKFIKNRLEVLSIGAQVSTILGRLAFFSRFAPGGTSTGVLLYRGKEYRFAITEKRDEA